MAKEDLTPIFPLHDFPGKSLSSLSFGIRRADPRVSSLTSVFLPS